MFKQKMHHENAQPICAKRSNFTTWILYGSAWVLRNLDRLSANDRGGKGKEEKEQMRYKNETRKGENLMFEKGTHKVMIEIKKNTW